MNISPERSSQWMVEFHKQLIRGKHVLLYGNVSDQFLLNDQYLNLVQFLSKYFQDEGFQIVGRYDIVDGLVFSDPSTMEPIFDSVVSAAMGGSPDGPAPMGGEPLQPVPDSATPQRRVPRAGGGPRRGRFQTPDQALDAIRIVLSQSRVGAAMVMDFSDKLVGNPENQGEAERALMVQLKKAVQHAAYLIAGPLAGRKNTLVIVAGQIGGVPSWFYQDNPFLALVNVGRPRMEERASFVRRYIANFYEGNGLHPEQVEEVGRDFADLTDGLTAWDLEAIRRTSVAERMSIANSKGLVDYYKYGQRDDPWERLDPTKLRDARAQIESRVIGQPKAIEAVVNMLLAARVSISMSEVTAKSGKPKGTFFFVGPTGVGKTELAKALAELIFGDENAIKRFDMSEYAQEHAAEKLTGSPPGYVGYDEGGHLTNHVMERPFSLLLFDEIEKAHGRVMDKFLQILEDGRLTDGKGQTAYFSQSVIIFTSNIGSDSLDFRSVAEGEEILAYEMVEKHYKDAVRDHFARRLGRPELLNRLGDNILVFDLLRPEHIAGICQKFLNALVTSAQQKRGLTLVFPDGHVAQMIRNLMLIGDNLLYGGRRIKTLLEAMVERPLNRWVFFKDPPVGTTLAIVPELSGQGILVNGTVVE